MIYTFTLLLVANLNIPKLGLTIDTHYYKRVLAALKFYPLLILK